METHNQIFMDAGENIVANAKKLLKEKDPEKRQNILERMKHLRHEADLCLDEVLFLKPAGTDLDERVPAIRKKLDKCMQLAEGKCAGEDSAMASFLDEDFLGVFFDSVEKSVEDMYYVGHPDYDHLKWMLDRNRISDQPSTTPDKSWNGADRMDHVTGVLERVAVAAQKQKQHPINILMSRANYEPSAIIKMKEALGEDVRIYGMYDQTQFLKVMALRNCMEKCCFGNATDYNVRNNIFDLAFQRFGGDLDYNETYTSTPAAAESPVTKDLQRFWRYLAPGGVLLYLVPAFMLRHKERSTIATRYSLLWSLHVDDKKFGDDAQLELLALRKEKMMSVDARSDVYEAVTNRKAEGVLPDEMIVEAVKELPAEDNGIVNLFSGPEDDILIIEMALKASTLKIQQEKRKIRTIEPLLPLKKGQIGQIIASGRLNGIIDEGDGYKHVIAGRVIKRNRHEHSEDFTDPEHARQEDITYINNVVEINAIGGDGWMKEISMG